MKKVIALVFIACLISGISLTVNCSRETQRREHTSVAVGTSPLSAPVYIADKKGFFSREGLDVDLRRYALGKDALDAVIAGNADFSTVADTPVMFAGLKSEKIYILAAIAEANNFIKIIARRDKGIAQPRDLKGKRIAVAKGTAAEYFLRSYLTFNLISSDSVRIIDMNIEETTDALANGTIDAVVSWVPFVALQQEKFGDNAAVLSDKHIYTLQWVLTGRQDYIRNHAVAAEKFLRAIANAIDYMGKNREEAQQIVAAEIGDSRFDLRDYKFDIGLRQLLLINLENQSRWAMREGLSPRKEIPDFLSLIYAKGLNSVKPDAITIILE